MYHNFAHLSANMNIPKVTYFDLGLSDYKITWDKQEQLFGEIIDVKIQNKKQNTNSTTPNYLIHVEHPHVFTLGKSGAEDNLLLSESQLRMAGATFYKINRGGDITYHGPGQIVGYPIIDLENFAIGIHTYISNLETVIIEALRNFDIEAGRIEGSSGVWIDPETNNARKICAIGVRASRYVTMHGYALNVNSDLNYFQKIVPCGIPDKAVTSMEKELGRKVDIENVKNTLKSKFESVFKCTIE